MALFAAVVVAQAAACATARSPVSMPARCLEKPVEAKGSPAAPATVAKDEAALNAKRWVYATYFNQMKKNVAEHWKPAEEYRRHDPDGSLYGGQVLVTEVQVTVRPDGSLDGVTIYRSSGLDFLDDTAVEAFENAEPLGEPPCKLLKDTGLIRFRFGFAFDTRRSAATVGEPASSP
jgi:TonB family protein